MKKTQGEIIALAIKELFTKKMLKLAFLPFIITILVFYFLLFYFMSDTSLSSSYGVETIDYIMQISAIAWIVTILAYVFGLFVLFWFGLFFAVILAGIFTPYIVRHLHQKYYGDITIGGYGTLPNSIWFMLKTTFMMILWLLILLPLYFIPFINIIAINLPFYYFFHKMLHFDVASNMLSKERQVILNHRHKSSFRLYSLFLYFLSMIPFVVLILPVFYVLYIAINYFEYIKDETNQLIGQ